MQFNVREMKPIPYSDKQMGLADKVKEASEKREMNLLQLLWRKKKNNFLQWAAKHCKYNGLRIKMHRWRGVNIGQNVYIPKGCSLDNSFPEFIYIEDNVALANEVMIITHSNPYAHFENVLESCVRPVVIKEGAWIGVRSIILRGVTIGEKSIVSAGTVVDKNVKPMTIVQGNPMKQVIDMSSVI